MLITLPKKVIPTLWKVINPLKNSTGVHRVFPVLIVDKTVDNVDNSHYVNCYK